MPVVISEKFNVETGDYGQFRRRILKALDPICPKFKGISVIGPRLLQSSKWIFVELTAGISQIVLAICAETLYLYAWRRGKLSDNYKWCVTKGDTVELPNSKGWVPFGGGYSEIGGPDSITISRPELYRAVELLYNGASDPINIKAGSEKAFLLMILVFCAGMRIIPIYTAIYKAFCGRPLTLPDIDTIREKHWRNFSEEYMSGEETDVKGFGIANDESAKKYISVLLYHSNAKHEYEKRPGWVPAPEPPPDDDKKKSKRKTAEKSTEISVKTGIAVTTGNSSSSSSKGTYNISSVGYTLIVGANILVDNKACLNLADFGASKQVAMLSHPPVPKYLSSDAKDFLHKYLQDHYEVIESKIRSFLDETVLDLKKIQTPLYEVCQISLNASNAQYIGCGAFGQVFMGMNLDSGKLLALTQAHIRELEEEVKLLKNLPHPKIVRYLGTATGENTLNLLFEFVPGGSNSALLINFGSFLQPTVLRVNTQQLLHGLEFLHQNKIILRDIKGENILVDNKGCTMLADFGVPKQVAKLVVASVHVGTTKSHINTRAPLFRVNNFLHKCLQAETGSSDTCTVRCCRIPFSQIN